MRLETQTRETLRRLGSELPWILVTALLHIAANGHTELEPTCARCHLGIIGGGPLTNCETTLKRFKPTVCSTHLCQCSTTAVDRNQQANGCNNSETNRGKQREVGRFGCLALALAWAVPAIHCMMLVPAGRKSRKRRLGEEFKLGLTLVIHVSDLELTCGEGAQRSW
eukprot:2823879-Amphidinium_carterae.1